MLALMENRFSETSNARVESIKELNKKIDDLEVHIGF